MDSSGGNSAWPRVGWTATSLTFVLVLALMWQALDVYLVFDGSSVVPTDGQATRYVWTASACVIFAVVAVIAATRGGSRAAGVTATIGIVVALAAALILSVPQDRFRPEAERQPLPADYEPCYSGSNECS